MPNAIVAFSMTIDDWTLLREVFEARADNLLDSVHDEDIRYVATTLDSIIKVLENGEDIEVVNIRF